MKRHDFLYCILLSVLTTSSIFSNPDTLIIKKNLNFVPFPSIGYNSDLGYNFGILTEIYNYGNGKLYPNYLQKYYVELTVNTSVSGAAKFTFDSKYLINGLRITSVLAYYLDKAHPFYGFNGYKSVYYSAWEQSTNNNYHSRLFYAYENRNLRFLADLKGNIQRNLYWITGIALWKYKIAPVDVNFINKIKTSGDLLPEISKMPGLYDRYVAWGAIETKEKNGGLVSYLKLGVVYDSRDFEANPSKGIWTELLVNYASAGINRFQHTKLTFAHRQYFPLSKKKLILAYRAGYQGTIQGKAPFFIQPVLNTSYIPNICEAVGGDETARGILFSRIWTDAFAYYNIELRWRMLNLKLINQNIFIATNYFLGAGISVKDIKINYIKVVQNAKDMSLINPAYSFSEKDYFNYSDEKLHYSAGAGIKIGINENSIISIDAGKALNRQDGDLRIYFGMNYLF